MMIMIHDNDDDMYYDENDKTHCLLQSWNSLLTALQSDQTTTKRGNKTKRQRISEEEESSRKYLEKDIKYKSENI